MNEQSLGLASDAGIDDVNSSIVERPFLDPSTAPRGECLEVSRIGLEGKNLSKHARSLEQIRFDGVTDIRSAIDKNFVRQHILERRQSEVSVGSKRQHRRPKVGFRL